jgi:hypothetical protein
MSTHLALRFAAAIASLTMIAGCGGGGAGTPGPGLPSAAGHAPARHRLARVGFKIVIPPKHRHHRRRHTDLLAPDYLTPAIQGVSIGVSQSANQYSGFSFFQLTPQATYCTGDGVNTALACTLSIQAPVGTDLFTVDTWDTPYWYNGPVISTGTVTQTISLNTANNVNITTEGVVTKLQIALDNPIPATGSAATIPIRVDALDGDDYRIVGNFDQPLVLSDSDTSGATMISKSLLASSTDLSGLTLSYTGAVIGSSSSATPTIQVEAQSPADLMSGGPFTANVSLYPGNSGLKVSPSLLHFTSPSASGQSITIGSVNASAPYYVSTGSDPNGDQQCGSLINVSGSSPTFTVTPAHNGGGTCILWVYDSTFYASSGGYWLAVPVSISPSVIP